MIRFHSAAVSVLQTAAAVLLLGACTVGQFPAQPSSTEAPSAVAADIWQNGAVMPTARSEMRVAVVDGIFYVPGGFGGLSSFEAYDPAIDSWTELAPMPEPAHHMMVTAHSGKVFVFGGGPDLSWQATASIIVYDPGNDTWTEAGLMPERRMSGEAVSLGDFVYLVGGTGGTTALLRFDPAEDSWAVLPGPSQPREHVAAVAFDDELWVIGGRWGGTGALATVEIFSPTSGSWRDGPEMIEARSGFGAAVVGDRIVVAGGEILGARPWTALASAEVYDTESGAWTLLPELPAGIHGMPVVGYGGTAFVLGGSDRAGGIDNRGRVLKLSP
ncbi:MAG: hypothetical protein OXI80_03800 [Caldilineaceae bacterium]|nr:hypothetical protein [Caldilineaceae bacterium]MDE0336772.1 hypothetical protein [Caldilineaceae bacterium]